MFGVHNLNMVYELVQLFHKPFGVVLNKCFDGENPAEQFCLEHQLPIIGRIPFDSQLGLLNSNSQIVSRISPQYKQLFAELLQQIKEAAIHEAVADFKR